MDKYELYTRFNGPQKGFCRICKNFSNLSNDHFPPQACFNKEPMHILNILNEQPLGKTNNGLNFRSICQECNSLLGSLYDKELKIIFDLIIEKQISPLAIHHINNKYSIDMKKVMRSLFGHILAFTQPGGELINPVNSPEESYFTYMRDCILKNDDSLFNKFTIYYWYHPFQSHLIIPYLGYRLISPPKRIFGSIIKFFPFAFWIIDNEYDTKLPYKMQKLSLSKAGQQPFYFSTEITHEELFPIRPIDDKAFLLTNLVTTYYAKPLNPINGSSSEPLYSYFKDKL